MQAALGEGMNTLRIGNKVQSVDPAQVDRGQVCAVIDNDTVKVRWALARSVDVVHYSSIETISEAAYLTFVRSIPRS